MSNNERIRRLANVLGTTVEELTRGSTSSGASAVSAGSRALQEKARKDKHAMKLLDRLGMKVEDLTVDVDQQDVQPFRKNVRQLGENVRSAQLPSQYRKNQQQYVQLEDTGDQLEQYANAQDMRTRINVFQGNTALSNIKKGMDAQKVLGEYDSDMAFVEENTDSYDAYKKYVQAALDMGDEDLQREIYTYGKDKKDEADGRMTKKEIDNRINELVSEIQSAKGQMQTQQIADPMGMMGDMVGPQQMTPVDTSKQEAELKKLYGMLESGNYISEEEKETEQKSYYERSQADYQAQLDEYWAAADAKRLEGFKLQQQAIESDDPEEAQRLRDEAALMDAEAQRIMDETQQKEDAAQAVYDSLEPKRETGKYVGYSALSGWTGWLRNAYETADLLAGQVATSIGRIVTGNEDYKSVITLGKEGYQKLDNQTVKRAEEAMETMGEGEGWRIGREVISGLVNNIPNLLLSYFTGGANAAVAGQYRAAQQAIADVGKGTTEMALQNAIEMVKSPHYWLSFSQTLGSDYEEALKESKSPIKAAWYASIAGLLNAGIEIGATGTSGIQGINQSKDDSSILTRAVSAALRKDIGAFGNIIDSASDEAVEELQQGIVSGLLEKVVYDADKPLISLTDENAVISPKLAEQMAVGGLTGGILGGGAEVANAAVGAYQNAEAQREYARAVEQYFSENQPVNADADGQGMTTPTAENAPTAENIQRAADLTGEETAYQYGESGRSQEELAETLASDNIPMTDAERLAFTKGETARQQKVIERRKLIDEKNRGGVNGTRKGTFRSISQEEISMLAERGIKVKAFSGKFSDKQRAASNALRKVMETMHINMVYFESPTDEQGNRQGANGMYDSDTNTVYLDVFAGTGNEQAIMRAAAHELTHVIQQWSPEKYTQLQDKLIKYYYSTGKDTLRELIGGQMEKAEKAGIQLTETQAMDEVTADACEMMFSDIDVMCEIYNTDKTLFQKIGDWITKFVDSIKTAMEGIRESTDEARLLMASKETWENVRKIWYQALEEAGQNNAGSVDQSADFAGNVQIDAADDAKPEIKKPAPVVIKKAAEPEVVDELDDVDDGVDNGHGGKTVYAEFETQAQKKNNKGVAYTADQTPIDFHYELVNAEDLIASNTMGFEVNEAYPQELQPRDRQRQASRDQVWNMARNLNPVRLGESVDVQNGAPIIGSDRVVESGNGRVLAVQLAMKYGEKSAAKYTKWLRENAASFGLDAGSVQDNSVLVRVRDSEVKRTQFVKDANESTTASYSESESAQSDSEKLTPEMLELFVPSETGRLDTRENHAFVSRFLDRVIPRNERASYVQQDGSISQRGWTRLRNAIFQRAYGSSQLTGALSEATEDGTKNVIRAMTNAAPHMVLTQENVKKQQLYDVKLPENMTEAARRYMQLKREGMDVNVYLSQVKMPGLEEESAGAQALMRMFDKYKGSTNQLTQALNTVMDVLEEYGEPNQVSMFGERVAPELADIVSQAQQRMDSGRVQYSLRERYDYTKPFAEQVEDWDSGKDFGNDTLVIGGTPQVLKKIGLVSLPLTIDQSHLRKILGDPQQETRKIKNKDHDLGKDFLKKLPEYLEDPVAIIRDMNEKRNGLVVILGEKNKNANNRAIVGAVKIDGGGSINGITIDANNLKTVHSRDNVLQMLEEAVEAEQKEGYGVYYLNKNKATQLFGPERVPGRVHSLEGGYMHSVADAASPVKSRVKDQTETAQFKRWFRGSKVVNADGTPKLMYHGTPYGTFNTFRDWAYFTENKEYADVYQTPSASSIRGRYNPATQEKTYEAYLSVKKPFDTRIPAVRKIWENEFYMKWGDGTPLSEKGLPDWTEGLDLAEFIEENELDYDAIILDEGATGGYGDEVKSRGVSVVVRNSNQIKSATDNIGTFDASNPDIRYSQRDTEYKTDRQLLASALEGVTKNAEEAQMLREYQDIAAKLDADERRVQEINERIRELRLEDVNTPEEQQLLEERKGLEKGITTADRRLFQMERLQPLQRIAKIQRKEAEEALSRAKKHLERYKEGVTQREYIARIKKTSDRLAKWLTQPNNQRYVPEGMRKPLAEFLLAIDRGSETMLTGGGMTQKDRDYARVVADLRDVLQNINAYQNDQSESDKVFNMHIDLPRGFVEMMTEHARKMEARAAELGGKMTLNRMNSQELEELFMTLTAISSSITHTNDFLSAENAKHVSEVSQETINYLREQKPVTEESKIGEFLNWDNLQPIYAFERYGEGGKRIFKMLQDGQSKLAFNTQEIVKRAEELYTAKEAKEWSEDIKTFTIGGKEVQIPVANIMSLYCLMRRQQGIGHLYGEGIRVGDFKVKGKMVRDDGHNVGDVDIARMISSLTERQKDVAEKLQRVMSTMGSRWGNEISMKRFGYRMFTEQNYFPIEVDRTHLPARTDNGRGNELYRLLNISSTKPITRGANNRIMLNSIFDVFSSHMSDMAQYNAMALPVLDAVKWLNYKESELEEVPLGEEKEYRQKYTESVRDAARDAYGYAANKYIIGVLRDINGAQMTGGEGYGKMMLGRVNRASVAANLRVAFLQPLSIVRAGMVLGTTDILKGAGIGATRIKQNVEEMEKYSGIAAWKGLGFYDVNIGRSVSKLIKHDETKMDKLIDASMKGAEIADRWTWALMWEGAKQDVARRVSRNSEDFMQKVAERFEEVVYKTQVVDSVLTRSQYMRNPGFFAKWTSSFMSEPTTTYNMLLNAYSKFATDARNENFQKAWVKNGKLVLRTMSVYTLASALNAVVESLMGAWRDEDDYTTFMEKFTGGMYDNFINNMMPFNKLPLVSDLYEYAKKYLSIFGVDTYGYSDTNVITQWLDQLADGLEIVADKVNGKATNYTGYGAMYKLMQGMSSVTGVPMASFMREAVAMWNNTGGYMTGNKIVVYKTSKSTGYQQLYNAIHAGNTQRVNEIRTELKENGAEDKNIISGLRSLAKQDYLDGNLTEAEAADFLQKHCDMSADESFWKLEEWAWEAQEEADDYSVYNELEEALLTGAGVDEAIKKMTSHGYEDSKVRSKVREIVKEGYLAKDLTEQKVATLLKKYGGLDDNEVYFKQQQYEYERLTGDSTTSDACMIFYAIDQKQSPKSAIDAALKHGKEKSGLASSLTSRYKEQYLELLKTNKSAAYQLGTRLAGIFDYLGYKGTEKVKSWEKK